MLAEMHQGVRESGQDPEQIEKMGQMSDLFEGLKTEVGMRRHSADELLAVYAKYQSLETAVYPYKKVRGGLASYDRWLLARDKQAFAPASQDSNKDRQPYAEQLQRLYMAGKFDEAKKLTDSMTAGIHQGHWGDWLAFLKELEANAYRTRIVIGVDPQSWGGKR